MQKVAIVTPDLTGPVQNGGIGTHCYYLAQTLAERGFEVSVVFTGPFERRDTGHWQAYFRRLGIAFVSVDYGGRIDHETFGGGIFTDRSQAVHDFLRTSSFDVIHFQDWGGNGFIPIQAKRTGQAYADTLLTVTMHSSSEWIREGMAMWPQDPIQDAKLDYTERYCCEFADLLISPTQAMFDWACGRSWRLAANRMVVPNCYGDVPTGARCTGTPDLSHLIFFGRLETRKGLQVFCDAIVHMERGGHLDGVTRLSFLGKNAPCNGTTGVDYLRAFTKQVPRLDVHVDTGLGSFEAIEHLKRVNGLIVLPSMLDNHPYTVVECIENNLSFIASNVGGIPEMVDPAVLFEPNASSLASLLAKRVAVPASSHRYSRVEAALRWAEMSARPAPVREHRGPETPLISVCIAFYNHGAYLEATLARIEAQTYGHVEVIVVNDGSTDARSIEVFDRMARRHQAPGWTFLHQANAGPGAARNMAAAHATGDYVVFVDADNLPQPDMLDAFVRGITLGGFDCLTCHFQAIYGPDDPTDDTKPTYSYTPLGACIEVGIMENCFGDTNFCIKRDVFEALGGFSADRDTGNEDWELLALLCLTGYRLDVVPRSLLWYRDDEVSFSRTTQLVRNHKAALRAYQKACPAIAQRILLGLAVPLAQQAAPEGDDSRRLKRKIRAWEARLNSPAVFKLRRAVSENPTAKRYALWALHKVTHLLTRWSAPQR